MKNIIKFILRMAVVAGIVIGIVFAINHFTGRKDALLVSNKSVDANIVERYVESATDVESYIESNTAKRKRIDALNKINTVLIEYYNHYLTNSIFENSKDEGFAKSIVKEIEILETKIDDTKYYMNLAKSNGISQTERDLRVNNVINFYLAQTEQLFKINDMLKNYVYKVNYKFTSPKSVYEVQLEMIKDYSKYVFDNEINGKINADNLGDTLSSPQQNGFLKVYEKFMNRQKFSVNGDKETKLFDRYSSITNEYLTEFYNHVFDQQGYIDSVEDMSMKNNLDALYNYIMQSSF